MLSSTDTNSSVLTFKELLIAFSLPVRFEHGVRYCFILFSWGTWNGPLENSPSESAQKTNLVWSRRLEDCAAEEVDWAAEDDVLKQGDRAESCSLGLRKSEKLIKLSFPLLSFSESELSRLWLGLFRV